MQTDNDNKQTNKPKDERDEATGTEAALAPEAGSEAGPEAGSNAPEQSAAGRTEEANRRPRSGSPAALTIALLGLLVAVGGSAAGYYVWQQSVTARKELESLAARNDSALQATRSAVQDLRADIDDVETRMSGDLGTELAGLRKEVSDLRDTVAQVQSARQQGPEPVIVPARIEHLLQMANDSLILERDVGTALAALQAADRSLRELGDPLFAETRRRLAEEVTALESLPRPDISGMAFTLGSLQDNLSSLPLARRTAPGTDGAPPAGQGPQAQEEEATGWRAFLRDVWEAIKGLVVIRRSESDDAPLLKPDQRIFLRQNLYLKLETARLALLERDQKNFTAGVAAARSWLERYYDSGAPAVAAMKQRLEGLGAEDIAPQMPDISGSLDALRAALKRRSKADSGDGPA